jgi:hypothetical protein
MIILRLSTHASSLDACERFVDELRLVTRASILLHKKSALKTYAIESKSTSSGEVPRPCPRRVAGLLGGSLVEVMLQLGKLKCVFLLTINGISPDRTLLAMRGLRAPSAAGYRRKA